MRIDEIDRKVTQSDIQQLERFADSLFGKVGIDVEFTRHFLNRVNDERNVKQITMAELTRLFKQEFKRWGKQIAQLGPDAEAVMKDMATDVNMPFALQWDNESKELDLIAKTVMRKKDFKTSNPEFAVEDAFTDFGRLINRSIRPGFYKRAAEKFHEWLKDKAPYRHSLGYYAMEWGNKYKNMDWRNLKRAYLQMFGDNALVEDADLNTQRGRLEYYMDEPIGKDVALHLGKLPKYFNGTDPLADMVPDRVGKFALHPDNWEGTYYSLTNKDTKKVKFYNPQLVKIPANSIVGDMAIANRYYRTKDEDEKKQLAVAYKDSIVPYGADTSHIKMPEIIMPESMEEKLVKMDPKGPSNLKTTKKKSKYQKRKEMLDQLDDLNEDIKYVKPQFDVEWEEANRYPYLEKLGQAGWEELAGKGKIVKVNTNSVKKIGNTGADGSESLNDLETDKVTRLKKAMDSGTVEMPIVVKQPDGSFDLVAGNTRLIGLISTQGEAKVWLVDASQLNESVLMEGGSLPGVGAIHIDEIKPTLEKLEKELGIELQDFVLGSVGKRQFSGDIDVAINFKPEQLPDFIKKLEKSPSISDMAKSSVIMTKVPIVNFDKSKSDGRPRTGFVQLDFMPGDPGWLKTYYHSPREDESKYKGVFRNIMLATIAAVKDRNDSDKKLEDGRPLESERYMFSPRDGLVRIRRTPVPNKAGTGYTKKDKNEIIAGPWKNTQDIIEKLGLSSVDDLNSFESLLNAVKKNFTKTDIQYIIQGFIDNNTVKDIGIPDELKDTK